MSFGRIIISPQQWTIVIDDYSLSMSAQTVFMILFEAEHQFSNRIVLEQDAESDGNAASCSRRMGEAGSPVLIINKEYCRFEAAGFLHVGNPGFAKVCSKSRFL